MMPIEDTELAALGAIVAVTPIITAHAKPVLRLIPGVAAAKPWPLFADLIAVALSLCAYYAGMLETISSPAEAALAGLVLALVSSQARNGLQGTERRVKATREALKTAGERTTRTDGVVVEEA